MRRSHPISCKAANRLAEFKNFFADKRTLVFLLSLMTMIGVPFLISQVKPIFGPTRYAIIALPAFIMLIGAALSHFADRLLLLVCCFVLLGGVGFAFIKYKNRSEICSDKAMTEYLVNHAANGDIIIYTSLSQTTTDYYLQQLKPQSEFLKLTFPMEINAHPGWRNVSRMMRDKEKLEREAENLVGEIKSLVKQKDRRLWLFYGLDREVGDILKAKLDAALVLSDVRALPCDTSKGGESETFYTEILIYQGAK